MGEAGAVSSWVDPSIKFQGSVARAPATLAELGSRQLASLAAACGLDDQLPRIVRTFLALLGEGVGDRAGGAPAFPSDVVDDNTPYELSLALGGAGAELRLLVEPTGANRSLVGRWATARALGRYLRDTQGADLERLDRVAELFAPRTGETEHGLLALWYAVAFRANAEPDLKAYVDLRVRGAEHAPALLEEALARLDLGAAYPRFLREAGARGRSLDELVYFSLDLVDPARARVKVYLRHHEATAADVERVLAGLGGVGAGEIREFCMAILGSEGPYLARPLVSCWSFSTATSTEPCRPGGGTLYVPVAYYAQHDEEARLRVGAWLDRVALARDVYDAAVRTFARRPLEAGVGLHSYVSFKRERGAPKLTTYLAPEAYRVFEPGTLAARRFASPHRPRTPESLVARYETTEKIADHPLFRRLAREAPAAAPIWTILANNWVGIGDGFPSWLGNLVARVPDDRMRAILAKQLADEEGDGIPGKAHRILFQHMLADLEPFAPSGDREALLAPGRRLAKELAAHYLARPTLEAVGGTLVMEVFGKQVDRRIGDLLRRETGVDTASLTWLVLHETLEEDHAGESVDLARLVPTDAASQEAVCRGAEDLAQLGHCYLDDLYEVIFR